jgi:hypothetical protein
MENVERDDAFEMLLCGELADAVELCVRRNISRLMGYCRIGSSICFVSQLIAHEIAQTYERHTRAATCLNSQTTLRISSASQPPFC